MTVHSPPARRVSPLPLPLPLRRALARRLLALACTSALLSCGELVTSPALVGTIRVEALSYHGAPLPDVRATLYLGDRHFGYAETNASGRATFSRVTQGTYGVFVSIPPEYAFLDEVAALPRGQFAVPLVVRSGSDTTVSFTLLKRGAGTVEISVVDSLGAPVSGINVVLYTPVGIVRSAPTNAAGLATFLPINFGLYGVFVTPPPWLGVPGSPTKYLQGLLVEKDAVTSGTIVLPTCRFTLRVLVLDDADQPVTGHPVEVYNYLEVLLNGVTGADGRVTFTQVGCQGLGVRVTPRPGFTIVNTQGQGYTDGITTTHNVDVDVTLHVVRTP